MKILLLDPQNLIGPRLQDLACAQEGLKILTQEQAGHSPADSLRIDVIVGAGGGADRPGLAEQLLMWRTHPHTYLVPCWIAADFGSFERICLWPRLSIDHFQPAFDPHAFCDWLSAVANWQQNRMHLANSDSLSRHGALELVTCFALRRATGSLLVFDEEGSDGSLILQEGCLTLATVKHLSGEDAFHEFFAWSHGSYLWEPRQSTQRRNGRQPLSLLINQGLRLVREANLLYHFLPDLQHRVAKTQSESALDDGGVPFYAGLKEIYNLVDGRLSAAEIIQASPLSRPRTMACLAKWFSLGDISLIPKDSKEHPTQEVLPAEEETLSRRRLLITDDSHFMCRALESIFSSDPRFEIVGMAHDGLEALEQIDRHKPEVVTLDIHMPKMDGLTALKHIMIRNPTPVVVLSSLTQATSQLTYESFKYGAVSVFTKPSRMGSPEMEKEVEQLVGTVWQAANVQMEPVQYIRRGKKNRTDPAAPQNDPRHLYQAQKPEGRIVVIGCGTGGFPSLLKLLVSVSKTKHLPFMLTCMTLSRRVVAALVPNMARDCLMPIEEVMPEAPLYRGTCYLYSYDDCTHLVKSESHMMMERCLECPEHRQPLDHLLISVAEAFGERSIAMVISGEGRDGMEGMKRVQEEGGLTYVLSPPACLSPELPRRILEENFAREIHSTLQLAALLESCGET